MVVSLTSVKACWAVGGMFLELGLVLSVRAFWSGEVCK